MGTRASSLSPSLPASHPRLPVAVRLFVVRRREMLRAQRAPASGRLHLKGGGCTRMNIQFGKLPFPAHPLALRSVSSKRIAPTNVRQFFCFLYRYLAKFITTREPRFLSRLSKRGACWQKRDRICAYAATRIAVCNKVIGTVSVTDGE